jgi:hypothetical protein
MTYRTKDFNEAVWLIWSGMEVVNVNKEPTSRGRLETYFTFPDQPTCLQMVSSPDFATYVQSVARVKAML